MKKILILLPDFLKKNSGQKALLEKNGFKIIECKKQEETEISSWTPDVLSDTWGVIAGTTKFSEEEFKKMTSLKILCKTGKGLDTIDMRAADRHNVVVSNTPGSNADAVAELTICLAIASLRNVFGLSSDLKNGLWGNVGGGKGNELMGKKFGFLGFGDIAQRTSLKLSGFGVELLAYDVQPNNEIAKKLNVKILSLDNLLSSVDVLSVHLPYIEGSTHHFLNKEKLGLLKKDCVLINTSRGKVIDQDALAEILKEKKIKIAALDTFEEEPLPETSPLLNLDNVILTPHIGGSSIESRKREIDIVVENLISKSKGENIKHRVFA